MGFRVLDREGRVKGAVVGQAPVFFKGLRTTDVGMASGYNGPLGFDEVADTDGFYNGSRFQPTKPGWYDVSTTIVLSGGTSGTLIEMYLTQNVTASPPSVAQIKDGDMKSFRSDGWMTLTAGKRLFFNGTTDYAEVWVWINQAGTTLKGTGNVDTVFEAESVGPVGPAPSAPFMVSSLPAGVPHGTEVYYDPGGVNSGLWHMRYDAALNKWRWVGGGMLRSNLPVNATTTGGGSSYSTQLSDALIGCSMTVPFAGDYWVLTHCEGYFSGTGPINLAAGVLRTSTGGTGDAAPQVNGVDGGTTGNGIANLHNEGLLTGAAAGQLIAQAYLYTAQIVNYQARSFWVRPALVS